ncbi:MULTISPECIES: TetR/AcrR family transcriptional regulator [Vibrio]|uniref:TetR/AcrR family transcriptional regulator n=1 Tax=Vibrio TaxID=662 RepID=UPI00073EBBB6|nr:MULTISPECIES: TetR/AcrR family transcriptional regulator [Vibrio]MCK8070949.1 TetR/AcrR family transcriptional regulator [Vibrio sp. 1CM23M]PMP48126.1 TetR family transcriptional regulator [Vibrio splendidus]
MDKRKQIIESAIELFATIGYEKTSVTAICEHSKVSKGLVFHHFKNKEGLLKEVFTRMAEIMNEVGSKSADVDKELSPKEKLESYLEEIFLSMASPEHRLYYQFDFQILCQPSTRALLKDLFDERYQLMMTSFQDILSDIPGATPVVDSHMIIAEIDGIALNYLFAEDDYPLTQIKGRFIQKQLLLLGF